MKKGKNSFDGIKKTLMNRASQTGMKATLPLDSISADLRLFSAIICQENRF